MNKKYRKVSYIVTEEFNNLQELKQVYKIGSGWYEIVQGCMGWKTTCGKNVFKDDIDLPPNKSSYTVRYIAHKYIKENKTVANTNFWDQAPSFEPKKEIFLVK